MNKRSRCKVEHICESTPSLVRVAQTVGCIEVTCQLFSRDLSKKKKKTHSLEEFKEKFMYGKPYLCINIAVAINEFY